jgi:hypothetical protein
MLQVRQIVRAALHCCIIDDANNAKYAPLQLEKRFCSMLPTLRMYLDNGIQLLCFDLI